MDQNERISKLTFASVYPHYLAKVEKKGRTKEELQQVIYWFTGIDESKIKLLIDQKASLKTFFEESIPNPKSSLIKGTICGIKIEDIENPLTRKVRQLDKLVDDLAKGKKIEKIIFSKLD